MTASENILADFPAEAFTIFVHYEACGHRGTFDRAKVPEDMPMRTLHDKLRCSACGSRHASPRSASPTPAPAASTTAIPSCAE
jgi:hypothetical protein